MSGFVIFSKSFSSRLLDLSWKFAIVKAFFLESINDQSDLD